MSFTTDAIKNTAIAGHVGTGKTSLIENILLAGGKISKAEPVENGKTVSDFTEEEIERKISIHSSLSFIEWNNKKLNFIDTPGSSDFIGEVVAGFRSCENALLTVSSDTGVQIETIKIWRRLDSRNMPRMVFLTKADKDRANFENAFNDIKEKFQKTFVPVTIPIGEGASFRGIINLIENKAYMIPESGKETAVDIPADMTSFAEEYRTMMIEAAAEGDDEILEKYFEEGTLTADEIRKGLTEGLKDNKIVPVFCGSASLSSGISSLLNFISNVAPAPSSVKKEIAITPEGEKDIMITSEKGVAAIVFKTSIDQFSGKLSFVKVINGILKPDSELINMREGKKEKVSKLYSAMGKKLEEIKELCAGDIGIITKLPVAETNDSLCSADNQLTFLKLKLPHPVYSLTVSASSKKEEDKLNQFLHKAAEEDLTFQLNYNTETKETIISGMGELHINMILDKIKDKQKISIETKTPQVAYRETITKKASGSYRHKKQSGGHGQFGEVHFEVQPIARGEYLKFINTIKGGSVSKGYIPGIEKGIAEGMQEGVLAGYPVVDIEVNLFDGKEHPVDSSEMSFKLAAKGCLKAVIEKATPALLEPVMKLTVFVEDQYLGDVLSDLSSRRGKVLGQDAVGGGIQQVYAEVPQAELLKYAIDLRSITSGTASFEIEFDHYSPISGKIAEAVIAEAAARKEEAE